MLNKICFALVLLLFPTLGHTQTLVGDRVRLNTGPCTISSGSGAPNGSVTGKVCDTYLNTADGVLWEKWTGTGNTGWGVGHNANETINGTATITGNTSLSGYVGHPSYVSQLTDWRITAAGAADFRYIFTDEMHAKLFVADLEQALAGGQIICKSVTTLSSNFTNPFPSGVGTNTATLTVKDLPSAENMAAFQSGDYVGLRSFSRTPVSGNGSSTGQQLIIGETFGVVTSYADQAGGVQTWTFTRGTAANAGGMLPITGGDTPTVVATDAIVVDYGTTGNGCHEVNAIDGPAAVYSPYAQTWTWTTSPVPANRVLRTRVGNVSFIAGTTNEYGAILGTFGTGSAQYVRATNAAVEMHNVNLSLFSGSTEVIKLDRTAPSLAIGTTVPSAYGTGDGVWTGIDGGVAKFRAGAPGGSGVFWNGSTLSVVGSITVTGGDAATIGYVNTADASVTSAASSDATTKANNAQSTAISTASGDATTKANLAAAASLDKATYLTSGTTTINGGTITTGSINVGILNATGFGDNLIKNGSFEGADNAAGISGWKGFSTGTVPDVICCGTQGPGTLRLAPGNNAYATAVYRAVPVHPAEVYHFSIDIYLTTGTSGLDVGLLESSTTNYAIRICAASYGCDGSPNEYAYTSYSFLVGNQSLSGPGWHTFEGAYTVPAGVNWVSWFIRQASGSAAPSVYGGSATTYSSMQFDRIELVQQIGPGHIYANSITADRIAANTITAAQIAANTITATQIDVSTITALDLTAGTISGMTITAGGGAVTLDPTNGILITQGGSVWNGVEWSGGQEIRGVSNNEMWIVATDVIKIDTDSLTIGAPHAGHTIISGNLSIGGTLVFTNAIGGGDTALCVNNSGVAYRC